MRVRREEDHWSAVSLCPGGGLSSALDLPSRYGSSIHRLYVHPALFVGTWLKFSLMREMSIGHSPSKESGSTTFSLLLSVLILLSPFQYWHVAHRCWFGWTDGITIVRSSFSCLGLNLCLRLLVSPHHEGELPAALICVRHESIQVFAEWRMPSREFEADWARIRGCLED